jgi:cyclopropane-fatty-acyl-phospholipid synthase
MNHASADRAPSANRRGTIDRVARAVMNRQLAGLRRGEVTLSEAAGSWSAGEPDALRATVQVHRPRLFRRAVLGGSNAVAAAYVDGDWDCDDLPTLLRICARNPAVMGRLDGSWSALARIGNRIAHARRANTLRGSRRNVAAHYDLGNAFFRLWLDETMAYSCALFPSPGASLRQASIAKFEQVCRKLELRPSDSVLEIGAGWGGFALHAAANYGCWLTAATLGGAEFQFARQRIRDAGLSGRVTLLQQDYRDLRGSFDKIVAIEVVEAVGPRYLDRFFRQCGGLLRPDGTLLLQAVVIPGHCAGRYRRSVDFLQRHIFPGQSIPSLGGLLNAAARGSDLRVVHAEELGPHYAETFRRWRQAFHHELDEVRRLGYSDEFIRMWDFYLAYGEAMFEERIVDVVQLQLDKPERRRTLPEPGVAARGARRPTAAVARRGRAGCERPCCTMELSVS